MKITRAASIAVIFALLVSSLYFISAAESKQPSRKPNILLVTVCSLRQDHLGYYGYLRNTSPNIDILAESSIVFENCHTHIPWTKPSTVALMTGRYPSSEVVIEKESALPGLLHSAGYLTLGVIGTNVVRDAAKADAGFDIFLDSYDLQTSKDSHTVQADTVADKAIELLKGFQSGKKPIFLWVFFKDPHWPYMPPFEYGKKFLNDPLFKRQRQNLAINDDYNNSIGGIGEARLRKSDGGFITDKAYYISQYDAEISFTDSQFGKIVRYLQEEGNYEDWIVILVSDHGESLGEEDYFFDHGHKITEAVTKIPLIVKLPLQTKKKTVNYPASICDIYPTMIKLSGLNGHKQENGIYGIDIVNNDGLSGAGHGSSRVIMLENSPTHEPAQMKLVGCIQDSYKLVFNLATNQKTLYDISKGETRLENYDKGMQDAIARMSKSVTSFFDKLENNPAVSREELQSLGYLQ